MSEKTQTYKVESPIKYDGKIRKIGSKVDLPDDVAEPLVELGRIKKAKADGSATTTTTTLKPETEVIAEIGKAQTKPDLSRLGKGDTRQPVLDAIVARLKVIESRPGSKDVIKKIKAAKTVDEVNQIVGKDDREGVKKEAAKKCKELTVDV